MTSPRRELSPAELQALARRLRRQVLRISHACGVPHLGSALSCIDLLAAVYGGGLNIGPHNAAAPDRDRFILSKGHAAPALYAALAECGFIPLELLDTVGRNGSRLPEQMSPQCVPGVEAATGSLGHGLSLGLGMALAARLLRRTYRVVVLLSDGECNEGSVWEAALFAAGRNLSNVTVLIDHNGWQATDRIQDVLPLAPLAEKWSAFGWRAQTVDGHNPEEILAALSDAAAQQLRPTAVVAHTIKGKGVSFMEDDNNWHYRIPNDVELEAALAELRDP